MAVWPTLEVVPRWALQLRGVAVGSASWSCRWGHLSTLSSEAGVLACLGVAGVAWSLLLMLLPLLLLLLLPPLWTLMSTTS